MSYDGSARRLGRDDLNSVDGIRIAIEPALENSYILVRCVMCVCV
jgi:hypothetical protein